MPDGCVSYDLPHINQVLLIGGENRTRMATRWERVVVSSVRYSENAVPSHRGRDPLPTMAKEQLALLQLLGCQSGGDCVVPGNILRIAVHRRM